MANTAQYVFNPGGGLTSVGANGMTPVLSDGSSANAGQNSMGAFAPQSSDPYTIFNQNLMTLLTQAKATQLQNQGNLAGGLSALTNLSVNPNGQTPILGTQQGQTNQSGAPPFNPAVSSGAQIAGQEALQGAFQPAIASVNQQLENNTNAANAISGEVGALQTATQPITASQGQSLYTKSGQLLARAPHYEPPALNLDPNSSGYNTFDSYDDANGVYKSDEVGAPGNGAGSHGYGAGTGGASQNPATQSNNNPFGIKTSAYVQNLFNGTIPTTTGSAAKDGGNFLSFESTAQGEKAARMLLQSSLYKTDTIDQAMRAWSGGAYNGNIVQGTGLDPQAYIKDLSGTQIDTLMQQMLKAEQGPGQTLSPAATSTPQGSGGVALDPRGLPYSTSYSAKVSALPSAAKQFTKAGPSGVAYFDGDTAAGVSPGYTQLLSSLSSQTGIPILTSQDISALGQINNMAQYLQTAQSLVNNNLSTGGGSSVLGHGEGEAASTLNMFFQSNPSLETFNSYIQGITGAANQLKSLVGGSGSGLRITGTEIAGITATLPSSVDSWQTAQADLNAINLKFSQALNTAFPGVSASANVLPQGWTQAISLKSGNSLGLAPGIYGVAADGSLLPSTPPQ